MKSPIKSIYYKRSQVKQRGVALFFALIALLAISLAAVALIRSVDTSTLIAGNLAFKQSATSSGDAGIEAASTWMLNAQNQAKASGINVTTDLAHPFNNDNFAAGYYSSSTADPLTINWTTSSMCVNNCVANSSGNTTRYIIQRMCSTANATLPNANCLFSGVAVSTDDQSVKKYQDVCIGAGCASSVSSPMLRITSRTEGPRNTVSFIQAFVY